MRRMILNDPTELADHIRSIGGLIVFDGRGGEGKTTLMREMAARLSCQGVDGDDFLIPDQGVFLDALRIDDLRNHIQTAFQSSPIVLLATVCARDVVDRMGLSNAVYVYVQWASRERLEHTRDNFDADIDAPSDDLLDDENLVLHRAVEEYHSARNPRGLADVAYIWAEAATGG